MSTKVMFGAGSAVRSSLTATALALPLLIATPARGEIIPAQQMAQGVSITPAQCAAFQFAVWVTAANRGFCIRYYVSTVGGQGPMPIVWLSGDKLGKVDVRTRRFKDVRADQDVDTDRLQQQADNISKQAGTTAIYLARPGLDGSSGYHGYRRSWLELYAVTAALDAIKRRHGFQGFHVAGQSGGSGLIGGLMSLRQDIGCAVPGSGRLAILKPRRPEQDTSLEFFDASQAIQVIARNRNMRILVVTDPQDKRVRVEHQTSFVRALLAAGGRIDQFYVTATDENRHGVAVYTRFVVAACVRGMTNQQIMAGLGQLQERHLAAAQSRHQRHASGPKPSQPEHQAGPQQFTRSLPQRPSPPRIQPAQQAPSQQHVQPQQQAPRIQRPQVAFDRGLPSVKRL
jgi:hypothetical protein